jgi:arylsulfatase A-like enzyme
MLFMASCAPQKQDGPYNVLFIAVDDLRPDIGAFGEAYMKTPAIDKLASEGRSFSHHYVQVPTCGASRYALWTGLRPSNPAQLSNEAFVRLMPGEERERPESFAHLFRRNGYHTVQIGKLSHYPDGRIYTYEGEGDGRREMPFSWDDVDGPVGKWGTAWNAFFGYADGSNRNQDRGNMPAWEMADVPDTAYADGITAEKAIRKLRALKDERFLLAVGFFKPHLPFTAPKKYWDLYDEDDIDLSPNPDAPIGVNPNALHDSRELFGSYGPFAVEGAAGKRIPDDEARTLRHAYRAAVSFSDAQVGKVLDELDRLGLSDHTIVVLWGDHGWHLGDHGMWCKHTNYEQATRVPLIVHVPNRAPEGGRVRSPVEFVDVFPTLCELANLPPLPGLEGVSLTPAIDDPTVVVKPAAVSQYPRQLPDGEVMGYAFRTTRHRYIQWFPFDPKSPQSSHDQEPIATELYDYESDPAETRNLVADPGSRAVAAEMERIADRFWQSRAGSR